uniref:Uncharacterized protein n=1 Tax=Cryptomonas curvata TaxID=233186 RepID=A0A7S0N255_9CRYP|mmetsp:Transcript_60019/g.125552  ORF Transcript_60019/g.125552 Transcript_60019/m.125552 type:complete len:1085 (+) Transcript_60019:43-3297(+)
MSRTRTDKYCEQLDSDFENPSPCYLMESGAALNPSVELGETSLARLPQTSKAFDLRNWRPLPPLLFQPTNYAHTVSQVPLEPTVGIASLSYDLSSFKGGSAFGAQAMESLMCSRENLADTEVSKMELGHDLTAHSGSRNNICSPHISSSFFDQHQREDWKIGKQRDPVSILRPGHRVGEPDSSTGSLSQHSKHIDAMCAVESSDVPSMGRRQSTAPVNCSSPVLTPREPGRYVTHSQWINHGPKTHLPDPRSITHMRRFSRTRGGCSIYGQEDDTVTGLDAKGGVLLEEEGELPTRTLERLASLETVVRMATQRPTRLTSQMRSISRAMARANAYSALRTSTPIAAALSKRRYQAVPLIIAAFFVYWAVVALMDVWGNGSFRGRQFLLNVTATRGTLDRNEELETCRFEDVELLVDGCPALLTSSASRFLDTKTSSGWTSLPLNNTISSCSFFFAFEQGVTANGFSLRTASYSNAKYDPIIFALYTNVLDSNSEAPSWSKVGASGYGYSSTGGLSLSDRPYTWPESTTESKIALIDLRAPWWWATAKLLPSIVSSMGFLLTALSGILGREFLGKWILVINWSIVSAVYLSAAIAATMDSVGTGGGGAVDRGYILWWLSAGGSAGVPATLVLAERSAVQILLLAGGAFLMGVGALMYRLTDVSIGWLLSLTLSGGALLALGIWLQVFREKVVLETARLIEPYTRRYEAIWEKILGCADSVAALQELDDMIRRARPRRLSGIKGGVRRTNGGGTGGGGNSIIGSMRDLASWAAGSQGSLLSRAGSRRIQTAPALVGAGWTGGGQRTSGDWGFGRQMGPAAAACCFAGSLGVSLGRQGPVLFYYDRFGPPPSTTPAVVNADETQAHSSSLANGSGSFAVSRNHVPVTNMDQLYMQACGLNPLLRSKVQDWADTSDGRFPLRPEDSEAKANLRLSRTRCDDTSAGISGGVNQYVRWEDAQDQPDLLHRIKWAHLKSEDRAIEKALRSYKGDVSRLVDICRQCIIFETVQDLCVCLRSILDDRQVRVVRIKNRLDVLYDARISAGYRDVSINLCLVGVEAIRLGLDHHVCEVQLLLREFADLKVLSKNT